MTYLLNMKKLLNYIIIVLTLILSVSNTGFGQQLDRSKIPGPGPAPAIQVGKPESFTLKNGLKVFVVTNKKLPRVAFNLVLPSCAGFWSCS